MLLNRVSSNNYPGYYDGQMDASSAVLANHCADCQSDQYKVAFPNSANEACRWEVRDRHGIDYAEDHQHERRLDSMVANPVDVGDYNQTKQ